MMLFLTESLVISHHSRLWLHPQDIKIRQQHNTFRIMSARQFETSLSAEDMQKHECLCMASDFCNLNKHHRLWLGVEREVNLSAGKHSGSVKGGASNKATAEFQKHLWFQMTNLGKDKFKELMIRLAESIGVHEFVHALSYMGMVMQTKLLVTRLLITYAMNASQDKISALERQVEQLEEEKTVATMSTVLQYDGVDYNESDARKFIAKLKGDIDSRDKENGSLKEEIEALKKLCEEVRRCWSKRSHHTVNDLFLEQRLLTHTRF